jgi:hypothetical protein
MKETNYSDHARARTQQRAVPHGTGWRHSTYNQTLAGLQPLIEAPTGLKCESAWGPGADRPHKRLIDFVSVGSMFGAVSHARGRLLKRGEIHGS